jgi:hypothetical protein
MFKQLQSRSAPRSPRRRGVISTEYMLVLACIVIPLALWTPILIRMTGQYCHRILSVVVLPFGLSF